MLGPIQTPVNGRNGAFGLFAHVGFGPDLRIVQYGMCFGFFMPDRIEVYGQGQLLGEDQRAIGTPFVG